MAASLVSGAFPGKAALVGKGAVEPDFLADGGLVLPKGSRDVGLGRLVADADLDDPAFLKGECFVFVSRHDKNDLLGLYFLWADYRAKGGGSRLAAFCGIPARAGDRGWDDGKEGLPPGERFGGEQGAEVSKEEADLVLGDRLLHEGSGKTGKGAKEGTVEGKGTVRPRITEAQDFNPDTDGGALDIKIERAEAVAVLPDSVSGMREVVPLLEVPGLLLVLENNFFLKSKVLLEKILMFHYTVSVKSYMMQNMYNP